MMNETKLSLDEPLNMDLKSPKKEVIGEPKKKKPTGSPFQL